MELCLQSRPIAGVWMPVPDRAADSRTESRASRGGEGLGMVRPFPFALAGPRQGKAKSLGNRA